MATDVGNLVQAATGFEREVGHSINAVDPLGIEPVAYLPCCKFGHTLHGTELLQFSQRHTEKVFFELRIVGADTSVCPYELRIVCRFHMSDLFFVTYDL